MSIEAQEQFSKLKQIVVLPPFQAVRKRAGMYVGSVIPSDEKILTLKNGKISSVTKNISVGFYRLFEEILDNCVDEHKRSISIENKGIEVYVSINSIENSISIEDTGFGFLDGDKINPVSGISNIESAFTILHAGSNFEDEQRTVETAGMNGIGAAVVNILSEKFFVSTTLNSKKVYQQVWNNFESIDKKYCTLAESYKDVKKRGTKVYFVPSLDIFPNQVWDKNVIHSKLALRQFSLNHGKEDDSQKIKFHFTFDGESVEINENVFPDHHQVINSKKGTIAIWETNDETTSFSMINGCICTGIHQKIVQEYFNEVFEYKDAHQFYDFFVSLDIPPKLMRFGDQSKTKFSSTRYEIQPFIEKQFLTKIQKEFVNSSVFLSIFQKIQEKIQNDELKKLRSLRKNAKNKISDKYLSPSKSFERLFICEGESAKGGLSQERNASIDGIYMLKGKIKNVRSISGLTENKEILDIMNILDLEYNVEKSKIKYKKIIIATDFDPDGSGHICSLVINFFARWFPQIIKQGCLYHLQTPLVGCICNKEKKYFYSLESFEDFKKTNSVSSVSYYKGLGSYNNDDWKYIFDNLYLYRITFDAKAEKFLDIAFGTNSDKRKKWLETNLKYN